MRFENVGAYGSRPQKILASLKGSMHLSVIEKAGAGNLLYTCTSTKFLSV